MKVLHTADWHIGQFKGPVVDGVNLRSQDTVNCLNYMIKVAEEEKPDIVCVSGDVFHQEQIGPARYSDEMIVATDTITKLAGVAKAVIVMRGTPNHDGGGQFRVLSKMFANTGNVHIVTSPTVLRTPYADIACIPGFDKQEFRSRFPGLSADEENEAWTSYISSMVMGLRAEHSYMQSTEHGKKEYLALFIMLLRNGSQSCFRMRRQIPRIISSYLFQKFIKMSGK